MRVPSLANAIFTGAGNNGITVRAASVADLGGSGGGGGGATLSGAGNSGLFAEYASQVRAIKADVTNCANDGIQAARGCNLSVDESNVSGAGRNGMFVTGCLVDVRDATANNASETAIYASQGSQVNASGASIDGQGNTARGFRSDGSRLNCLNGSAQNCTLDDIEVIRGGLITADGTTTTNSTGSDPHESDMNIAPNTLESDGIIFAGATEV